MAALIHHHHCHHPATASAAISSPSHRRLKPFTPSQVTSYLSPSKTPLSLSSSNPHFFPYPSFSLSKFSSTPKKLDNSQPLSNHELSRLLKLSIEYADIQLGKAVHASVLKFEQDVRLFNSLITSYFELGKLNYAERVFDSILAPDVVSYTAMISGLAKSNCENEALGFFFEMRDSGIEPNAYSFVALLTVCMRLIDLRLGFQVHALSIKTGHINSTYVANAVMGLYTKCSCLDYVVKLFDEMSERDVASWNTVISCVVKDGMHERAFELFHRMLAVESFRVDYFTLSSLVISCARCFAKKEGAAIHAYALKIGYGTNLSVKNALIEFYAKCGCVEDVETLFNRMHVRDVYTWTEMIDAYMGFGNVDSALEIFSKMPDRNCVTYNALLAGFCQNGEGFRALRWFCRMVEEGMEISDFTLTSVLHACGLVKDSRSSEQIHAFVLKIKSSTNNHIKAALLDMCTRCGRMEDAERIFHHSTLERSSSIMLTAMICGYARNSEPEKAISLICQWLHQVHDDVVDEVAIASILGVCADLGFRKLGEQFYCRALKCSLLHDIGVGNAVISMYSKCGDMEEANKVFDKMPAHDIVSWNSLLAGYNVNRQGGKALEVWKKMQRGKIQPDTVTCVLIISAYRHTNSNLIEHCKDFFRSMKPVYNIEPNSDHYACLVGVLGNWGLLEEAEELIENIPFEETASVWRALLDSCGIHKNAIIGTRAAKKILSMEPQDPSTYILKSNLYSASGRWNCSEFVREEMKERRFRKFPGRSWVIDQEEVHSFFARDKSHPESKDIYSVLDILFMECLRAGYKPDTSFVLHDVEEHQKVNFLLCHSAKLAVSFGLITTRVGKPVRVVKNIHMCGDCHTFLKYVTVVTKREIHVRDASGFHCFADGECSCRDNW
ncbi:hypothetical protein ABFS82_10G046700 [Erythranthe guttata]|uniref:pentatricopeptide repeat-containing protein At5g03800 n=1 Tax=Erythranthe guttata TaxID=4155 RepID=UPI00064DC178|nr:PREDICTED: pentatricopeptide repeat-containing protein At5g03800 [Erythranthe guttata]|eukprot:XP_012831869.1 PREDICTED: pentatricopeptide repeat-containing protein At5g03800 [Erythranthe guttata]